MASDSMLAQDGRVCGAVHQEGHEGSRRRSDNLQRVHGPARSQANGHGYCLHGFLFDAEAPSTASGTTASAAISNATDGSAAVSNGIPATGASTAYSTAAGAAATDGTTDAGVGGPWGWRFAVLRMETVNMTKADGKVTTDRDLGYLFSTLKNGTYNIIIKRAADRRTMKQNDLMWLWLRCIEHETGTPKEDAYLYYCKKFLCKVIQIGERLEKVYETSSRLNTQRMTNFLECIKADAAAELGIQLPLPEDEYYEQFYQQYKF